MEKKALRALILSCLTSKRTLAEQQKKLQKRKQSHPKAQKVLTRKRPQKLKQLKVNQSLKQPHLHRPLLKKKSQNKKVPLNPLRNHQKPVLLIPHQGMDVCGLF